MKRNLFSRILLFIITAAVSFSACACGAASGGRDKLRSPGNFAFDAEETAITFGRVDGAQTYTAYINKDGLPVKQFLDFTGERIELGYMEPGAYTAKVHANKTAEKDASNYAEFNFIVPPGGAQLGKLDTPAFIEKTGNNITWYPVAGAAAYTLKVYDKLAPSDVKVNNDGVNAPPYNVSGVSFTSGRDYVIEVTANAVQGQFLQSETGAGGFTASSLPTLNAPQNVNKSGNTVTWSEVAGAANGYRIIIFDQANPADVRADAITQAQSAVSYAVSGGVTFEQGHTYVINVYARAVYNVSQQSAAGTNDFYVPYPGLTAPAGITVDSNFDLVSWSPVPGAQTYALKIYNQSNTSEIKLNDANVIGASRNISGVTGFAADSVYVFEVTANAVEGQHSASGTASVTATAPKYRAPQYGQNKKMNIGVYHAPGWSFRSQSDYNTIAALGVNLIVPEQSTLNFAINASDALQQLDRAQTAGLKVIVHDWYIQNNLQTTTSAFNTSYPDYIDYYKSHPAFYGVEVRDEPNAGEFNNIRDLYALFKARMPADKYFVNLYPGYAGTNLGTSGSSDRERFRNYVDGFVSTVKPSVLSYDHYPLLRGTTQTVRGDFFHDLEYVSRKAHAAGIPANNILLSTAHAGYGGSQNVYDITESEIRWQAACAMAYGYQSYMYYNYCHKDSGDNNAKSLIDWNTGAPTAQYYRVQNVTGEIRAWEHVYMNFNWHGTAVAYSGTIPAIFSNINQRANVNAIGGMTAAAVGSSSQQALIGQFTDAAGYKAFMLVNASRPGASVTANVSCTFESQYGGLLVYAKGVPSFIGLNSGQARISLEPGEGKFVIPVKLR